ncbi:pyrroline-5-carboxylate reductase family protein [Sphingomonas bacterium]|uniref:pyrroline-5-carboxylate reductase family protein n=1 Tax=Sphingomonas bacterium TaxID=1895847 RepID=UPI00157583D2|nr:pyrroline-5-carboxylate reductase dimerization domain-containing protein [Sphingomonas bacterium]
MGGAMLRRWLEAGLDPARMTVVSPSGRAMPDGVRVTRAVPDERFDTVMLGFKPYQLGGLRPVLAGLAPRLLVSILAGVEVATLAGLTGAGAIVRAMPNLPVAIGKGVVALHGTGELDRAEALMAPLGLVERIADEALFDVVTALAGSGPGFLYRWIDAVAQAGAALGLPADQAARLALATVEGSAMLAARAEASPAALAERVASPGGSTREGLNVLDRDGALVALLTETLRAAAVRNAEMAAAARG